MIVRVLHPVIKLINHPWVVAVAILVFGAQITNLVSSLQILVGKLSSSAFFDILGYIARIVLLVVLVYQVYLLWRRWKLVHFKDEGLGLSFDPILKFVNVWRRRQFDIPFLVPIFGCFPCDPNHNYYNVDVNLSIGTGEITHGQKERRPIILFKIPAREHVALADFQDLRLIRHIVGRGGRVIIIIMDVPYEERQPNTINIEQCFNETYRVIKRVIGSTVVVHRLSKILSRNVDDFLRFLFDVYIPFYATKLDKKIYSYESKLDTKELLNRSYLIFALILKAIDDVSQNNRPLMIIQWKERLFKWNEFADFITKNFFNLRISGFIIAESLLTYAGEKFRTAVANFTDKSFTLTEDSSSVARKLLSSKQKNTETLWEIPDDYLIHLSKTIFGYTIKNDLTGVNNLPGKDSTLRSFYQKHTGKENIPLNNTEFRKSLYIRYQFHEEFSRIQRSL